jgi:hypothetical protein
MKVSSKKSQSFSSFHKSPRACACGRMGVKIESSCWVCARCLRIQAEMYRPRPVR